MLAAEDVRALADPELGDDTIAAVLGGATMEAFMTIFRRIDFRDGCLADLAAEDDLLEGYVGRIIAVGERIR